MFENYSKKIGSLNQDQPGSNPAIKEFYRVGYDSTGRTTITLIDSTVSLTLAMDTSTTKRLIDLLSAGLTKSE